MISMFELEDLDRASLRGAATLVRVDFNAPLASGRVMDDTRLRAALPTLHELRAAGARVVLMSHCGRPKGEPDPAFSLRPMALALEELIGDSVAFAEDCVGDAAKTTVDGLQPGQVCLLENLRFHPGEKNNSPEFAERLAALGDAYVNDAFGTAHRAHASVVGVAGRAPQRAAGRLLVREVESLGRLLADPERPFAAVVGGAKIGSKVGTLENLLPRLDLLILGGGMANTFLAAQGHDLAASLVESDRLETARDVLARAEQLGVRVLLPGDLVITDNLDEPHRIETVPVGDLPAGSLAVDIGEASRTALEKALAQARTIFWNGPMGVFEVQPFDAGTVAAARAVASCPGFTVIGGGETVAAAGRAGIMDRLSHVSTGGGASLELLAGRELPGVTALEKTT